MRTSSLLYKIMLGLVIALTPLALASQAPVPARQTVACQVDYTVNAWNTGFTADVKITNLSATAINGWTLTWTFTQGEQITSAWSAIVTQTGANVTATNAAWNGAIGANGGSVSFGFQATHGGAPGTLIPFSLNGMACTGTGATNTPTRTNTGTTPTNTPTRTNTGTTPTYTPTSTLTRSPTRTTSPTRTNTIPTESSLTFTPTRTPTRTNTSVTPTSTPTGDTLCQVTYAVSQWSNGFTADVKIINNSSSAISGWTLTWTFANGQLITSFWNATVTQSGANVTASNPAGHWNGTIGANGGSVAIGFQATYGGANAVPTNFVLNGAACTGPTPATNTPTRTPSRTPTGPTPTPTATLPPGSTFTGNATYFDALGMPYGGCGITQAALDTQNFVALNVQNSPNDYTTMLSRPIAAEYASQIGLFNNGLNCGRWVRVSIGDYCNGTNDGAPNQSFCRGGTGWVSDKYNDATLDMIVADSCQDGNAWCRDDFYHLDLAKASLNLFVKDGAPIGDMYPTYWNNRQIHWQFIEAPNYTGDIRIGFLKDAQIWWTPVGITHLQNGIHGMDYYENGVWVKAGMDADMGQTYLIRPTTSGGTTYRIRIYDVADQLINNGRIYNFAFPASCGTQCSGEFNEITYTVE